MKKQFKYGAYIYKNTEDLRNKLESLGYVYEPQFSVKDGTVIATYPFYRSDCPDQIHPHYLILTPEHFKGEPDRNWIGDRINCETDENKFISLVSEIDKVFE